METETEIIRSCRKTVSIQIVPPGRVVVRAPATMSRKTILKLLEEKKSWITAHLARAQEREADKKQIPRMTREDLEALKKKAEAELLPRLRGWAEKTGVTYRRVTFRSQKTRWGSCSARGNLNLNCLLALCPREAADYVMVHELCHRREMNHSARFWAEVERVMPDYRPAREWLRKNGPSLMARLPEKEAGQA